MRIEEVRECTRGLGFTIREWHNIKCPFTRKDVIHSMNPNMGGGGGAIKGGWRNASSSRFPILLRHRGSSICASGIRNVEGLGKRYDTLKSIKSISRIL